MGGKNKQTISMLLDWACAELSKHNMDMREARDLLSFSLDVTESYLVGHSSCLISSPASKKYKEIVRKRLKGIPFSYITQSKGFYGLDFFVDKRVLIPRADTEGLIDWTLQHVDREKKIHIVDIGTGSGCIAITLAKYFPHAQLTAVDTSEHALVIEKKNARLHKVAHTITFKKGSLLTPIKKDVDLVVSNPPYLEKHELGNVPFEPVEALYGGKNGLEFIDQLLNQIIQKKIQAAIIEISPTQEHWLAYKLQEEKEYSFRFLPDLTSKIRFVVIQKRPG